MEETDVLYPGKVRSMCAAAIADLNNDDLALDKAKSAIANFVSDDNLNASAYTTLKEQMEAYYDVITLLKAANGYDVDDYITLLNSVGDRDLIGADIVPNMKQALEDEEYYISERDKAIAKMNIYYDEMTSELTVSEIEKAMVLSFYDYYFYLSKHYDLMAAWNHDLYKLLKILADEFDRINTETSCLFLESSNLRSSALDALDALGKNFSNGQYGNISEVKSSWLNSYKDQIDKEEELEELRDKLNISIDEYYRMNDHEKIEFTNDAIDYIALLTGDAKISPGSEIHVQLSDQIEITYKVEASLNGEICNDQFGKNNYGNTVMDVSLGDISVDAEIDTQRKKLEEVKFALNDSTNVGIEGVLNTDGIGTGIVKTVGDDTYEGIVVTDLRSMTTSKILTSQFDLEDDSCFELESEIDVKFSLKYYDEDMEPAYVYEPVEVIEREYDVESDLAWLTLGGVGTAGVLTLSGLGVYYGGSALIAKESVAATELYEKALKAIKLIAGD